MIYMKLNKKFIRPLPNAIARLFLPRGLIPPVLRRDTAHLFLLGLDPVNGFGLFLPLPKDLLCTSYGNVGEILLSTIMMCR